MGLERSAARTGAIGGTGRGSPAESGPAGPPGSASVRRCLVVVEEALALPGQQPVRMGARHLDQTQDRMSRDRATALVVMQGPERDLQRLGQEGTAVDSV